MSIKATARAYLRDAGTAFERAPLEVALAVLTAVFFSYAVSSSFGEDAWLQIFTASVLAFGFAWCGTLLHALGALSFKQRWALTFFGALAAALYLLAIPDFEHAAEGWRAFMLLAGVALLVFAAPAWTRDDDAASLRLRRINGRFLLRAIGLTLYGLALFAGLALALAAIDKLFELKLADDVYQHTFGWIMLVLVPWVVVGGLESYVRPLDEESDVARVVHRLTAFLVPPLLVLYFLILYTYALRIAITGEIPKNLVSPMVLAAGLLSGLALILFDPPPNETRAGFRLLRLAPAVFIPLVPLGLWALLLRVHEYGWTEFRLLRVLLVVLLGVIAVLAAVQLVRRRPYSLRVPPLVVGVALLIGAWVLPSIALRDQQIRLKDALVEAGIDVRRIVAGDTTRRAVNRASYQKINDAGWYLQSHFGAQAVQAVTGIPPAQPPFGWSLAEQFRLITAGNDSVGWTIMGQLPFRAGVTTSAGTTYRVQAPGRYSAVSGTTIRFSIGSEAYTADLQPLLAQVTPSHRREQRNLPPQAVPVRDRDQTLRGDLVVFEAMVQQWRDSVRVRRLDGILVIRPSN